MYFYSRAVPQDTRASVKASQSVKSNILAYYYLFRARRAMFSLRPCFKNGVCKLDLSTTAVFNITSHFSPPKFMPARNGNGWLISQLHSQGPSPHKARSRLGGACWWPGTPGPARNRPTQLDSSFSSPDPMAILGVKIRSGLGRCC